MKNSYYMMVGIIAFICFGIWYYSFDIRQRVNVIEQQELSEITTLEIVSESYSQKVDKNENSIHYNSSGIININSASKEELMLLPQIGEKLAEDIIAYRETNGNFATIEDITKVKGIGKGTFESVKDRITT